MRDSIGSLTTLPTRVKLVGCLDGESFISLKSVEFGRVNSPRIIKLGKWFVLCACYPYKFVLFYDTKKASVVAKLL